MGAQEKPAGPDWARKLPVYEVEVDRFTKAGTFKEFEAHLPRLKRLGVGILWLMPIFPRGGNPKGMPASNSPYCVRDYLDVNPRFGTKEDFKHLVQEIHRAGLYVILDFVPNHTSWGNELITTHPEYYKKDKDGNIVQAGPWSDVAQLDYGNREVWEYLFSARKYWITEFDVDGFREDVAGMIPIEHWKWLRPKLDALKSVFMLAEADAAHLHPVFDMTYDWTIQPYLWMAIRGKWPISDLDKMLGKEREKFPAGALRMRHLTNHDMEGMQYAWDNRAIVPQEIPFLEKTPMKVKYGGADRTCAVLCATLPGKFMVWTGQELGYFGNTPWPVPWQENAHLEFYTKLLRAVPNHAALYEGDFRKVPTTKDEKVYAYVRAAGKDRVVVVLSFSEQEETVTLKSSEMAGEYTELFTGEKTKLSAEENVTLKPWEYRVYAGVE